MADNSLDDLLQEALADFGDAKQAISAASGHCDTTPLTASASSAPAVASSVGIASQTGMSNAANDAAASPSEPAASALSSQAKAPRGLGLGLGGGDPLGRRQRKPAASAANDAIAATSEEAWTGQAAGVSKPAPQRRLAPDAQRLADDLLGLLEEAGLGASGSGHAGAAGAGGLAELLAATEGGGAGLTGADPDDPIAQLFGRMMAGMAPGGAGGIAAAGAAAAASAGSGGGGPGAECSPPALAALMQQLMGGAGPGGEAGGAGDAEAAAALAAVLGGSGAGPSGRGAAGTEADDDDALASSRLSGLAKQTRKVVEQQKKKTRGHVEGATAARADQAAAGGMGALGGLLQGLGGLGGPGGAGLGGPEGEGGAGMMVDFIMQHLLSKDVLYGPLKEIRDRYPPWLEARQSSLPPADYSRYVAQYESIQRVCRHYEQSPADYSGLMELIQEMQSYGDPPGDIVEEMTGGAGRELTSALALAGQDPETEEDATRAPALEELTGDLDKCKMQ